MRYLKSATESVKYVRDMVTDIDEKCDVTEPLFLTEFAKNHQRKV